MAVNYKPPFSVTSSVVNAIADISELVGMYAAKAEAELTPSLRRSNRIRTIQASLAIENNSLNVDQVTDIINGMRVMGLPREIQEVRNAFAAYEQMESWDPSSQNDLLEAHRTLTAGLWQTRHHL